MRLAISGNSIAIVLILLTSKLFGSAASIGPNGIGSAGLGLTGAGIDIGQVELNRPGDPTQPNSTAFDLAGLTHLSVDPAEVFFRTSPPLSFVATPNPSPQNEITSHSMQVAGVLVSSDPVATGVAPDANLFSIATNPVGPTILQFDQEAAVSANHISTLATHNVRVINMSFGNPAASGADFDGNSHLTQFVDWSAAEHDVLYVVAGNQGSMVPIPKDNFNGMTIGRSAKVGSIYRKVSSGNTFTEDAFGERTSIDLIAPGEDIRSTTLGNVLTPTVPNADPIDDGTSFAAPHVTGTASLLQEHADNQITAGAANWTANARRHEVMKAVLMNSADKLIDNGTVTVPDGLPIPTGGLLGMERTVLKTLKTGQTAGQEDDWFDSDSWDDSVDSGFGGDFPLDEEMGAGHLNASRALQQFATGEHEEFGVSGTTVPVIGWDYGTTTGTNDVNRYRFNQELQAGSFVAITLASDREVVFDTDGGTPGVYDIGDTFEEYTDPGFGFPADDVINDLGLWFQPAFAANVNQARAFSTGNGTLQHIFFQVETTDEFEFWVRQTDEDVGTNQDYAVAWWALGTGPLIAGDFDNDNDVDGADLLAWQRDFGGAFDATDLLDWEGNFGVGAFSAVAAVPEPASWLLLAIGVLAVQRRSRSVCSVQQRSAGCQA